MSSFTIVFYRVFSFFGFILFFAMISLGTYDVMNIDKDFSYTNIHLTSQGIIKHGYVIDAHVYCENKFLALELIGIRLVFKETSAERQTKLDLKSMCEKWKLSNISVPLKAPQAIN